MEEVNTNKFFILLKVGPKYYSLLLKDGNLQCCEDVKYGTKFEMRYDNSCDVGEYYISIDNSDEFLSCDLTPNVLHFNSFKYPHNNLMKLSLLYQASSLAISYNGGYIYMNPTKKGTIGFYSEGYEFFIYPLSKMCIPLPIKKDVGGALLQFKDFNGSEIDEILRMREINKFSFFTQRVADVDILQSSVNCLNSKINICNDIKPIGHLFKTEVLTMPNFTGINPPHYVKYSEIKPSEQSKSYAGIGLLSQFQTNTNNTIINEFKNCKGSDIPNNYPEMIKNYNEIRVKILQTSGFHK